MNPQETSGSNWTCYNSVGDTSWDDKAHMPCNMTAVAAGLHSTCCAEGDLCLTNGLCLNSGDVNRRNWYWRDGCTDKTWTDPACPKHCEHIEPTRKTGLVMNCLTPESWCCAIVGNKGIGGWPKQDPINTTCCSKDDLTFRAADPVVYATAASLIQFSTQSGSALQTVTELSTVLLPATATPTNSSSIPSVSGGAQQSSDSAGLGTGAKVGLGVGIPVALILLCAIGVFCWRRRKQKAEAANSPLGTNGYGGLPPYQETDMKQQDSTVYRHEAPSTQGTHELPVANGPSQLPQMAHELPAAVKPVELPQNMPTR